MSNTTARTVTNAAKKAIRLAGLKDVVVKVSTRDNGDGTFATHVETIHDRSKAVQEKIVVALKAERFAVSGITSEGLNLAFAPVVADVVPFKAAPVVVEPVTIGEMIVGKGKTATTVADLVSAFRAEGAKGRKALAENRHDFASDTLATRIELGELLVKAHLVGLVRNLFAEQQDLLALHPATKADPATRTEAQERLSVARRGIAGYLTYPVAKTALRAA